MEYRIISADDHIDLQWLPKGLCALGDDHLGPRTAAARFGLDTLGDV
ncbi:MAG: hypothetical protein ACRELA_02895 [Candidatus Rokuibacteriota bacterium]